jgi:hypothetical protein
LSTSPPLSPSPSKERGKIILEGASPLQTTLLNNTSNDGAAFVKSITILYSYILWKIRAIA